MPKSKKVGRPKLPKSEAKGKIIQVRLTGEEFKAIEAAAKSYRKTNSEWIRSTLNAAIQQ
jgi:uncharacterized protein (DUF1778 family)